MHIAYWKKTALFFIVVDPGCFSQIRIFPSRIQGRVRPLRSHKTEGFLVFPNFFLVDGRIRSWIRIRTNSYGSGSLMLKIFRIRIRNGHKANFCTTGCYLALYLATFQELLPHAGGTRAGGGCWASHCSPWSAAGRGRQAAVSTNMCVASWSSGSLNVLPSQEMHTLFFSPRGLNGL